METDAKTRYCFLAEWFDVHAELYRQYEFFYYPSDHTIEMYDIKQRRTFLKRTKSDIKLNSLFLGAAVNVNARQLLIRDYADEFTRRALTKQMQSTLLVIKPAGLPLLGSIINGLLKESFTICRLRYMNAGQWLSDLDPSSSGVSGQVVVAEILKPNVLEELQTLINGICF